MRERIERAGDNISEADEEFEGSARSRRAGSALRAGDIAPEFRLVDHSGQAFSLRSALKAGPVVLSFLSGRPAEISGELDALDTHAADIARAGASTLALSPITIPAARSSVAFRVLHDAESGVASAYGLCPSPITPVRPTDHTSEVPIPATFVIDQGSRIVISLTDVCFHNQIVRTNVIGTLLALRRRRETRS
jgi:peroxiredoxin